MILRPLSSYAHELKGDLPKDAFAPSPSRLLWLVFHLAVVALGITALGSGLLPWFLWLPISVAIGCSFAGLTFVAHETLHGAVVRNRVARDIVGWLGFLPFAVSPRLWIAWHNKVHHGHTAQAGTDPDSYPTLAAYNASKTTRVVTDSFSLGNSRLSGLLSLLFGFTGQSGQILVRARATNYLDKREHRLAMLESGLAVLVWATVAFLVGPLAFIFAFLIPLMIGNAIIMAFILTNHGLSPLTDVNDPLVNSLSVTLPRVLDWATLRFGLHVEHHLFPAMSPVYSPRVRELLMQRWPERYQSMPMGRALLALHRTARVYKEPTILIDPRTGREWPALTPRALAETVVPPAPAPLQRPSLIELVVLGAPASSETGVPN